MDKRLLPTSAHWRLRWATFEDSPTIMRFVRELAEFEEMLHEVVVSAAQLRADFEAGRFECILAEPLDGGPPVGFALVFHVYSTFEGLSLYLEDLYVSPEARGSGAGSALLRGVASIARSRDCARLQWQALSWNQKAIDFYTGATVGARQRVGDDGTQWLNFIMHREAIARLAGQ